VNLQQLIVQTHEDLEQKIRTTEQLVALGHAISQAWIAFLTKPEQLTMSEREETFLSLQDAMIEASERYPEEISRTSIREIWGDVLECLKALEKRLSGRDQ